jgi:ketopantoate reductase
VARFLVVGAGALGSVFGVLLEHQKHEVAFLVRPGRRAGLGRILLAHASTGETRARERPKVYELGEAVPPFEWALLTTRGDQLDEGVAAVNTHLRPDCTIAVCAPATPETWARLVAAHPGGPLVAVGPVVSVWSEEPGVFRWFLPPLLKTMVSGEGDPAAGRAAAELAGYFTAAGLPARAVPSLGRATALLNGAGMALLAGWELAGWDLAALSRDRELAGLTATAMAEATRASGERAGGVAGTILAYTPATALRLALSAMARLVPADARAMWRHHGPKIRLQTRTILDELLTTIDAPRLAELRRRLPEVSP